jgi:hypothetical protein
MQLKDKLHPAFLWYPESDAPEIMHTPRRKQVHRNGREPFRFAYAVLREI